VRHDEDILEDAMQTPTECSTVTCLLLLPTTNLRLLLLMLFLCDFEEP
jgi:hypothetical protein